MSTAIAVFLSFRSDWKISKAAEENRYPLTLFYNTDHINLTYNSMALAC
jgi:hypothetical protein